MDYFFKRRFSFWLVFLLVIINIAAISTMIYHGYSEKPSTISTDENTPASKVMISELKLTPDQQDRFHGINRNYNRQSAILLSQLTEKRSEMLAELGEEIPDTMILNTIAADIGQLHADLKLLTIQNFLALKEICTPEQKSILKNLYHDLLKSEGHFEGYGKKYRHRYGRGQGGGRGWQKNN